jgi:hypothetical protein
MAHSQRADRAGSTGPLAHAALEQVKAYVRPSSRVDKTQLVPDHVRQHPTEYEATFKNYLIRNLFCLG